MVLRAIVVARVKTSGVGIEGCDDLAGRRVEVLRGYVVEGGVGVGTSKMRVLRACILKPCMR